MMKMQREQVKKVQEFKYLGSIRQCRVWKRCKEEIADRMEWAKKSGVIYVMIVGTRVEGEVHKMEMRSAFLYDSETALTKKQEGGLNGIVEDVKFYFDAVVFSSIHLHNSEEKPVFDVLGKSKSLD